MIIFAKSFKVENAMTEKAEEFSNLALSFIESRSSIFEIEDLLPTVSPGEDSNLNFSSISIL